MIAFRSGKASILVATDVAGRGLHIRGLPYIVNYDFPSNLDSYVHRVGRTGRLAANGHAFSFFTRSLARLAPAVLKLLRASGGAVDPNLVILAEAWEEAVRQDPELANVAVPDDDEEEEEEEDMQVEDDIDQDQAAAEGHDEAVDKNSKAGRSRQSNSSPHETAGKDKQISGKKRKSLPGRLRKKLAKEKAAKGK